MEDGDGAIASLTHIVGSTLLQGLAMCLIMFLILVPYFAFRSLGDALGHRYVTELFLRGLDGVNASHP